MNKVIKLGTLFHAGEIPDFGSIRQKSSNPNILYLLAEDIPKLNGMLTRATAQSYMPEGESFDFSAGTLAFVVDYKTADSGKIYAYHRGMDHWYEFNIRSDLGLIDLMWNRHARILRETKKISGTPPLTFKSNGRPLKNYRIYGNTVNDVSVGNPVTEGEHTGEYCVPVTLNNIAANIYLPEPLRKVCDETDYIDYQAQTLHRVRYNLISNITEFLTAGTRTQANNVYAKVFTGLKPNTSYTLASNVPYGGTSNHLYIGTLSDFQAVYEGNPAIFTTDAYGQFDYMYATRARYDDLLNGNYWIMLVEGSTPPAAYEPYIQNTDLDLTLPVLSTETGVNILSVDTLVNPSAAEIKRQ